MAVPFEKKMIKLQLILQKFMARKAAALGKIRQMRRGKKTCFEIIDKNREGYAKYLLTSTTGYV